MKDFTNLRAELDEAVNELAKVKDVEQAMMQKWGSKVALVGRSNSKKSTGIVPAPNKRDTDHARTVYKIGNGFLLAVKYVGTAPWSYETFKSEADIKANKRHARSRLKKTSMSDLMDMIAEVV